jgi:prepilin-type processing-associated H-X9-DG protein
VAAANALFADGHVSSGKTQTWSIKAMFLGGDGTTNALPALRHLAQEDPDIEVRKPAAEAIIRIEQNHY